MDRSRVALATLAAVLLSAPAQLHAQAASERQQWSERAPAPRTMWAYDPAADR